MSAYVDQWMLFAMAIWLYYIDVISRVISVVDWIRLLYYNAVPSSWTGKYRFLKGVYSINVYKHEIEEISNRKAYKVKIKIKDQNM